ncbi:Colicin immunity protein / pyocin immunity protein [Pseudomonas helmanticensis]|uniref:Colicin immunity protein / pyocin immunity protein n=1 Tax=Pseudomonas helmanticensis TaxID=1471381 RepID=A0ACD2UEY1_9PSED|nr:bacteriocin immunity protein [Pseudomonas helmanticensis]SMQ31188.1 Colicin immunity protein / pyocin immunity protein [Pseudomonas helmanticensis]
MVKISEYTEAEFIRFIEKIRETNKGGSDTELGELLARFRTLTGHPDGTDLIFYPEPGANNSAEGIAKTVKEWRTANGLPSFKQ